MTSLTTDVLQGTQHLAASPTEDIDMLEKGRLRAVRRHAERKVQKRRLRNHRWLNPALVEPRVFGRLRHNHFGCGCTMCKPWKHRAGRKWAAWDKKEEILEDFE